jgi:hypothetical protein
MVEIPAHWHQAITRLIAVVVPALIVASLLLRGRDARDRRRVLASAAAIGALCAVVSVVLYTRRGAGTGTQTAWGWPRVVYSLWQSWETGERTHGIRWRGLVENAVFYGALAAAFVAVITRPRGAPTPRGP